MSEAVKRGIGYIGWSWAGNNDPILDMTSNFNAAQLTTWGERIVNGPNGIRATSKQATIFGTTTTPPPTTPPPPGGACTATYSITGSWAGGFQADVKVTAGSATIKAWTVTWTYTNGQTVTQAWNATVTSSGAAVTARNATYNGTLPASGTTSFGFLGSWNTSNPAPTPTCTTT
jgi:mannan endo-1,4-beta-mannosidase